MSYSKFVNLKKNNYVCVCVCIHLFSIRILVMEPTTQVRQLWPALSNPQAIS